MAKSRKRSIIFLLLFLTVLAAVGVYFNSRVYWKYNDNWIIGKSREKITERYGDFDWEFSENVDGYLIQKGSRNQPIADPGKDKYYYIRFNDKDEATEVFVDWSWGG